MSKKQKTEWKFYPLISERSTDDLIAEIVRRIPQPKMEPPFCSPTPAEDAASVDILVRIYMLDSGADPDTAAVDLIANLLHWADHQPEGTQESAEDIVRIALGHHDAEIDEEAERASGAWDETEEAT